MTTPPFSLPFEAFNLVGMDLAKMEKMLVNDMNELREAGKQVLNSDSWATIITSAGQVQRWPRYWKLECRHKDTHVVLPAQQHP